MKREILYLNAESFTSMSACVREVLAILNWQEENKDGANSQGFTLREPNAVLEFLGDGTSVQRFNGDLEGASQQRDCKVVIRANSKQREELESELEPIKQQWRVKVEDVA